MSNEKPADQRLTVDEILSLEKSTADARLDGNIWKGDQTTEQRVEQAYEFYTTRSELMPQQTIEHLRGIRFDQDVTVETLPPGTFIQQYQTPEANTTGKTGHYFAPLHVDSSELGIEGDFTQSQNRICELYQTTAECEILKSEAAHISHWKTGELLYGGGTQYFIPKTDHVERLFSVPERPGDDSSLTSPGSNSGSTNPESNSSPTINNDQETAMTMGPKHTTEPSPGMSSIGDNGNQQGDNANDKPISPSDYSIHDSSSERVVAQQGLKPEVSPADLDAIVAGSSTSNSATDISSDLLPDNVESTSPLSSPSTDISSNLLSDEPLSNQVEPDSQTSASTSINTSNDFTSFDPD